MLPSACSALRDAIWRGVNSFQERSSLVAFCTNCGSKLSENSRFCPNCGYGSGTAAPQPAAAIPPLLTPLDYNIQGDNLQIARVRLQPGQEVYAEAGRMIYKTPSVLWETRMSGHSIGEKIWGAVKRKLMGESFFWTYFRASAPGEVGFAGSYPGRIQAFDLAAGQSILVQRDSFLFAQSSVQIDIALVKKLGVGFFGGEGFILQQLTGPGSVFIHAGGDFVDFDLAAGEVLQVETGSVVAFDQSVQYDIELVGGIRNAIFGGEGVFLTTLSGPGRAIIQSMTLEKMRREMVPLRPGGDEHKGWDALSGIFDQD
jgi:uncharacterized protein (TIGR00266 family)